MEMDLKEYRGYLDEQMLRILGQMERPSEIIDYLYLVSLINSCNGSFWSAIVCVCCVHVCVCVCAHVCVYVCVCVHVHVHVCVCMREWVAHSY